MKILLLSSTLGNFGEVNGVATTYNSLLPYYKKDGHEVDIVTFGPKNEVIKDGSITTYIHKPVMPIKVDNVYIGGIFFSTPLINEVIKEDYDVIHVASSDSVGSLGMMLHLTKKIPLVHYFHTDAGTFAYERTKDILGEKIAKIPKTIVDKFLENFCKHSDTVLVENKDLYDYVDQKAKVPVRMIDVGIDTELFNPNKKTHQNEKPELLFVGRITKEKNLNFLKKLKQNLKTVAEIKIVGTGDYLEKLKEFFPDATYTGKIIGEALAREYANADIFVFPSVADTFGLVIREAMSSGIPAIAFEQGGPKAQVIHGENGFLAKSEEEFIEYTNMLLMDKHRIKIMGKNARKYTQKFSYKNQYDQIINCYKEILG